MSRKDQSNAAAGLQKWITDSADQFKVLAQKRDADGPMQDRALDIVRAFIIERKLVLYGGLAIDYALRLKGSRIYPDDERPDFDVFSANSVQDAYDLADILYKAGFENVGAIRAIHVQTMRVKTDFIFVADISHTPADVFASLPFVTYRGIRVLHPDYQRMDMHLAFCFPFAGAPREDVFHRWKKDLKRFNIINRFYPVTTGAVLAATEEKKGGASTARAIIPHSVTDAFAIHGFAAYGLLRDALDEMMKVLGIQEKCDAPKLHVEGVNTDTGFEFRFDAPDGWRHLVLVSPTPAALVASISSTSKIQWFDPFMDARPAMGIVEGLSDFTPIHVHSSRNKLLSVSTVNLTVHSDQGPENSVEPFLIVSPQALLLYFLYEAHRAEGENRRIATAHYLWTLEIINAATRIVSKVDVGKDAPSDTIRKFLNSSPFFLSTHVMGLHNHDSAYLIKMAGASRDLSDTPPAALGIDPDIKKLLDGLPANYHPKPGSRRPEVRYDNPLFRRAGKESVGTPVGI